MFYVYKHIRKDKDEVFYIGIGEDNYKIPRFYRSKQKLARSSFWKRIISKTDYEIEIIYTSDNVEEVYRKEREFIKIYGRRDLGLGTLCNLNDGGEKGNRGYKRSKETIDRHRKSLTGLKQSENWIKKAKEGKYISVASYDDSGNLIKQYVCAKLTKLDGFDPPTVTNCCKGKRQKHKNLIWKYVKENNKKIHSTSE